MMTNRRIWSIFGLLLLASKLLAVTPLQFDRSGQSSRRLTLKQITKKVKPVTVTIVEPHEKKSLTFKGFPLVKLLNHAYGNAWRDFGEILFICADNYKVSIPVQKIQQFPAYLTYALTKGKFRITNRLQNNETILLGPYYLIWDTKENPELGTQQIFDFPYQVTKIDLIHFDKTFPKIAPPKDVPLKVTQGFILYRTHCMTCHTINGQGGTKSIELNYPTNVTEYMKPEWLKRWILDPTSVRYNTTMPALSPSSKHRDVQADNIITYLQAMKNRKLVPSE